jgi:uncharacterized protein (TIGR03437 family)
MPEISGAAGFYMSDDGQRIVFMRGRQAWIVQSDGSGLRPLTADPAGIAAAILSGSGKVVYAATAAGRLLKIKVDTGEQIEIIGRTPYLSPDLGVLTAGMLATVPATGLPDSPLQATPPLSLSLGNVTIRIGDRKVPIVGVTSTSVSLIVPWDIRPSGTTGQMKLIVESPGVHTPFDFPESTIQIDASPRAGGIAHQNWDGYVDSGSPAHAGEIIHILAVGLGPVNPEVPDGTTAPSVEPLARLAAPMACSNSEVLYAGLAPGTLERVYQIDLRLGAPGYRQFTCSISGVASNFLFVTLNVVP